jgi:hypothetical protein
MTETSNPLMDMTDEGLQKMLGRALRNTLLLGIVPALVLWAVSGWRNAAMLAVGTLISAASIWEWQRLAKLIAARLDNKKAAPGAGVQVLFFVLRLTVFAGAIYVTLKCFQGSPLALLCGLGLAVTTMAWEGIRLLRE